MSNWNRRQVSKEEKTEWINGLAKIYRKQGYKISSGSAHKNEIINKIMNVTGLSRDTVIDPLDSQFKQAPREHLRQAHKPRIPASKRITKELGKKVVERHRKEILQEVVEHPEIVAEVIKEPKLNKNLNFLLLSVLSMSLAKSMLIVFAKKS